MINYEIWHDEHRGDNTCNEYWHGILFLPEEKKESIINLLKKIRIEYGESINRDIKFAGTLQNPSNKKSQIVKNNIDLFSHLLLTKEQKTKIFHRTQKQIYEKSCKHFLELNELFGCKFVIFYIPDNHKSLGKIPMTYADRVETTFRMGFKGGVHLLFSENYPINIINFYFDGHEHNGRSIDKDRILKGDFKTYCSIDSKCKINDIQMKDRDPDSKILMSFVDNIIGAWTSKLKQIQDPGNILFSLNEIYSRLKDNKIILNNNGRWYKSISVSKLIIQNDNIIFPSFFDAPNQPTLFDY